MSVREILAQIPLGSEALSDQRERYREVIVPEEWNRSLAISLEVTPGEVLKNLTSPSNSHHDGNHSSRVNSRIALAGFYVPEVIQQSEEKLRQILRPAFTGGWIHDHQLNCGESKKTQHGELEAAVAFLALSDLQKSQLNLGMSGLDPYFTAACCYWHSFSSARNSEGAEYLLPPLKQIIQTAAAEIRLKEGKSLLEARPQLGEIIERISKGDYPAYPCLTHEDKVLLKYTVDRMRVADEMDALIGMESILRTAAFDENRPFMVDFPGNDVEAEIQERVAASQDDKNPDDVSRVFDEMVGRSIRELGSLAYESGVMKFFITGRLVKLLQMAEALVNDQSEAIVNAVYSRFAFDLRLEAQQESLGEMLPMALENLYQEQQYVSGILNNSAKRITANQYVRLARLVQVVARLAEQKLPTPPFDVSHSVLAQKLTRVPGKYLTWQI